MSAPSSMRREFTDRDDLIAYLRQHFPDAERVDPHVASLPGGRRAALDLLARIEPSHYGFSRNYLDGVVTRLSAYIRHGVLTLSEVRDRALQLVESPLHASKFVTELTWREYWQRLYRELGTGIWHDREDPKTGFRPEEYSEELPADILYGQTDLACMDGFSKELRETGYLHNHARMWLAAYVVHWRRVRWQAGARWFLEHLLDGDPASNNLSWQWVASTFSHKPYFFNRENLEKYTRGMFCRHCPSASKCPFEGDYATLAANRFPRIHNVSDPESPPSSKSSRSLHRQASPHISRGADDGQRGKRGPR